MCQTWDRLHYHQQHPYSQQPYHHCDIFNVLLKYRTCSKGDRDNHPLFKMLHDARNRKENGWMREEEAHNAEILLLEKTHLINPQKRIDVGAMMEISSISQSNWVNVNSCKTYLAYTLRILLVRLFLESTNLFKDITMIHHEKQGASQVRVFLF